MSDETPPLWAHNMEGRLLTAMRADVADVRAELADVRANMATRTNVADIMERIDRLQEALTRQQESSVVEFGTAEMALRKIENTRSDVQTLTEMVLALTRNFRRMDAEIRQMRGDSAA